MRTPAVVLNERGVATVAGYYEVSIAVPQLVRDDCGRVTVPEGLYRISMTPIVECGCRQPEHFAYAFVRTEGR